MSSVIHMERRVDDLTPDEARLIWMHVLHKAVEDYENGKNAKGRESKKAYKDAEKWIWSPCTEFPSFLSLCDIFELNPANIRSRLQDGKKLHVVGEKAGSGEGLLGPEFCNPWLERAEGLRGTVESDEESRSESTDL